MTVNWGSKWRSYWISSKLLEVGWMITAAIVAVYVGAILPNQDGRGVASQRGTGLASVAGWSGEPVMLWKQSRLMSYLGTSVKRAMVGGVVGEVPGGIAESKNGAMQVSVMHSAPVSAPSTPGETALDRKMVHTCLLEMIGQKPAEAADKIRGLAERLGGFLVSSAVRGGPDAAGSSLTIRVPAARCEEVRQEIRKLGLRMESERIEAQDVTRQYVDDETNLNHLRAEEAQYLAILKQAKTVKDMLEVSEKLGDVRGQIEQQQAEFKALAKQVETVAIEISVRREAVAQVPGLQWSPLFQLKVALRDGLDALAEYTSAMTAFIFCLPAVLLWLGTIMGGAAMGWRVLRWSARICLASPKPQAEQNV